MNFTKLTEETRIQRQNQLDAKRTQTERNKLGQFATPTELAVEIIEYSKNLLLQNQKIKFLDPAFGTGAFYSALLQLFPQSKIESAVGYEIDSYYNFWRSGVRRWFTQIRTERIRKCACRLIVQYFYLR
jgi:predicted RNA methylase